MPALTIHADFQGLRELVARLDLVDVRRDLGDTIEKVGGDAERCLQLVAPRDTGNLADHIKYSSTGALSGEVRSTARNKKTGFPYTGVTRFGHGEIRPKHDITIPGSKRHPALRFVIGGRVVYVTHVRAWRPPGGDWARKADGQVRSAVDTRMRELRDKLLRDISGR